MHMFKKSRDGVHGVVMMAPLFSVAELKAPGGCREYRALATFCVAVR